MLEFNARLEQIKKKLLDLSKRNKLINYRRPNKSKNLKMIDESPEFIYDFLVDKEKTFKFKAIPYPHQMPEYLKLIEEKKEIEKHELVLLELARKNIFLAKRWSTGINALDYYISVDSNTFIEKLLENKIQVVELNEKLAVLNGEIEAFENSEKFSIEAQAKALGLVISKEMPTIELDAQDNFDIHLDDYLQTLHYPNELEKILKSIELQSRSIMEVTGSNMLYFVLGILEWREADKPEVTIKSPLITVPVMLKRMAFNELTNTYEYTLSYTGDLIESNESLAQRLFNDFKIQLPKLTEEVNFNDYIREVQKICLNQNNWSIKHEIALDFLQFGKILMYKDLDNKDKLKEHPVLRDIFLGKSNSTASYAMGEYDIDKELKRQKMPLVLDADSSQHSAMIDVLKGKNVVIEGPPGSGKSQIIANLIALLMYEGKKVLFVSEKMVALEVVHQRLAQLGLGDFCMELHSHKTDKVTFLQSLHKRIEGQYAMPFRYEKIERELFDSKEQLSKYIEVLHRKHGNDDKTIFENIWLREQYLEAKSYFVFKISNAKRLKVEDLKHCETFLKEYETHYENYKLSESFWFGFEVSELSFTQISEFIRLLERLHKPYVEISNGLKNLGIESVNEPLVLETLKHFLKGFKPLKTPYFTLGDVPVFQNLENKLTAYLQTLSAYISASEIHSLSSTEILDALETSSALLEQLASFEGEVKPEVIAFQRFIERSKKADKAFEEIEARNSKNLHLPMVNHRSTEDIYAIVSTVQAKRDSWFRFFSSDYKKAKKSFSALLKDVLPSNSDDWTFLLRELNVYALNHENKITLRLTLIEKVPLFIAQVEKLQGRISTTLIHYKTIQESSIEEGFKKLLFEDKNALSHFEPLIRKANELENLSQALKLYGVVHPEFWGEEQISFVKRVDKLNALKSNEESLSVWISFQRLLKDLKALGLKALMEGAEQREVPVDKLVEIFYFNYYNSLLEEAFLTYPILEKFTRVTHDTLVQKFQELDKQYLEKNQQYIAHHLSKKVLPVSEGQGRVATFTNLKLLQHEIGKKRRHVPIRQLLKRAGGAIQALKPCFMMSPLSVAQYMPIEKSTFDVLLIDEASQLKPEESLGVISRAKQVVVVGDPKQMPPTAFFDVIQEEAKASEKTVLDDSESILDSFIELYHPIRRLKWHYRSQHESLIDFSNRNFYDGELTIFPSTSNKVDETLGLKYTYVADGIYRGGNQYRINQVEAQKVLEQIQYQMKFFPEKSLGVGTLNGTQQELIQSLVDEAEKKHSYMAIYIEQWKQNNEAFFVKNLESLQGDERDVILISTTYGKEEGKEKLAQRFGPINQENGWRRLNVLITRSKQKMHVFTSMLSTDIRRTETSSRGVKALEGFLKFLEQGSQREDLSVKEKHFPTIFSKVLYDILTQRGYKLVPNVGVSGYYIDLAVCSKKDDSYILAIECDGQEYASANSSSDRERLKVDALKRLGWNHYRIWSMEWYKNQKFELMRLLEVIEKSEEDTPVVELLSKEAVKQEESAYYLDLEQLNSVSDKLSFDESESLYLNSKLSLELLDKCKKLNVVIMPFSFVQVNLRLINLPSIETLIVNIEQEFNTFPLELMYELLLKQPSLKTFGIKYNDVVNKFKYVALLEHLFKEFSNLERIHFFYQSEDDSYEDYITIKLNEQTKSAFIITDFKESSSANIYELPFLLLECTTLTTLILPNLKCSKTVEYLLDKNKGIKIFTCNRAVLNDKILAMQFETLNIEEGKEYHQNFALLVEELQSINDPFKEEVLHQFLVNESLSFIPYKLTILKLLQSQITEVRKKALEMFERHHNDTVTSLENLNIFLGTKADFDDIEKVKDELSKIKSKLNVTLNSRTKLLVLGSNNKMKKDIPLDMPMISVMRFKALLREISESE